MPKPPKFPTLELDRPQENIPFYPDQLEREPNWAYQWFIWHLRSGPSRSIKNSQTLILQNLKGAGIAHPPSASQIAKTAAKYGWRDRCDEYDRKLFAEMEASDRKKWDERKEQAREEDWLQATKLRAIVDQMINDAPKFIKATKRIIPADKKTNTPEREIITMQMDAGLLPRFLDVASRLQQQALGNLSSATNNVNVAGNINIVEVVRSDGDRKDVATKRVYRRKKQVAQLPEQVPSEPIDIDVWANSLDE